MRSLPLSSSIGDWLLLTDPRYPTPIAAELAADVLDVPTVLIARTDSLSAALLTSDIDPRDHEFITGERTAEGFFVVRDGLEAAIARSLAMQPVVMLFDEITSALDPELVGEVLKVLEEMARDGMTMMLVTHEIGFARKVAHRVVFMHEGRIWEEGPAAETLAKPRTPELETFLSAVLH